MDMALEEIPVSCSRQEMMRSGKSTRMKLERLVVARHPEERQNATNTITVAENANGAQQHH